MIFRHLKQFDYIHCDIKLSFLVDSAGRDLFCKLCLPWHFVYHLLPPVRRCSNLSDHGHQIFITISWATNLPDKSTALWMIWGSIWLIMSWSGTERYWRWHRRLDACVQATGGHSEYSYLDLLSSSCPGRDIGRWDFSTGVDRWQLSLHHAKLVHSV